MKKLAIILLVCLLAGLYLAPAVLAQEGEEGDKAEPTGVIYFSVFDRDEARLTFDLYRSNVDGTDQEVVMKEASQPCVSPDGKALAYRSWLVEEYDRGARGLVVREFTAEGKLSADRWIFTPYPEASRPSWGPESQFLLFHSYQEADRRPRILRTEGEEIVGIKIEQQRWLEGTMPALQVLEGKKRGTLEMYIIYNSCLFEHCGLYRRMIDGTGPAMVVDDPTAHAPAISPDMTRVAYMSKVQDDNWEVYVVDIAEALAGTAEPLRLTNNAAHDGIPTWSPDGEWIAFASNLGEEEPEGSDETWAIWAVRPDGGDEQKLFDTPGPIDGKVYESPDYESRGWIEERLFWAPPAEAE